MRGAVIVVVALGLASACTVEYSIGGPDSGPLGPDGALDAGWLPIDAAPLDAPFAEDAGIVVPPDAGIVLPMDTGPLPPLDASLAEDAALRDAS